jgi:hypothetical protein
MAKTRTIDGHVSATTGRGKKTRQGGGNVSTSTMNKNRKLTIKNIEGKVNERQLVPEYKLKILKMPSNQNEYGTIDITCSCIVMLIAN